VHGGDEKCTQNSGWKAGKEETTSALDGGGEWLASPFDHFIP
jgi:hypothetical protein